MKSRNRREGRYVGRNTGTWTSNKKTRAKHVRNNSWLIEEVGSVSAWTVMANRRKRREPTMGLTDNFIGVRNAS